MQGHFALASFPVSGKLHTLSSPSSSVHIITAKTSPKLETREPEQTLKSSFSDKAETRSKQVNVSSKSHTESKPIRASGKAGIRRNPNVESPQDVGLFVLEEPMLDVGAHAMKNTSCADEHAEMDIEDEETAEEAEETTEEADGEGTNIDFEEMEDFGEDIEMFVPPGVVISEGKPIRRLPGSNILLGPYAKNSRVKQSEFVKSSPCLAECPIVKLPEFAMVGRSNVGKSSLINSLVQRKDLAQTSKKPGKTQLINHFIINKSWYLVDLPGYGYAKVPAKIRASWDGFTKDFFLHSKSLVCVMLLVDGSIPPQQIDLEYAAWLRENKVPLTIVFTKCDRKKKKKNGGRRPAENVKDFLKLLKEQFDRLPPWIMTSCVTNQGKDELLMHMSQLRNYWSS